LRFDNPITDHGFEFPDLADFPGVEDEPRFIEDDKAENDLRTLQESFDNDDWQLFSKTFSKYCVLDKKTRGKIKKMFAFYQWFENSRVHSEEFKDSEIHESLYEQGYYPTHIDLTKVKNHLQDQIQQLYEIEDHVPNIGSMDRHKSVGKVVLESIHQVLDAEGILDAASKYLARERKLKVGSAYLHIGTPTDSHWKQFYQDQTYISKTTNLHIDPVEDQIKVMLYLNDVDLDSGPFSYIPYSNRWIYDDVQNIFGRAIATGCYCNTSEKRKGIFRLPKRLRVSFNFGRTLLDTNPLQQRIIGTERLFTSNNYNCIVFDPAGMHRGGICNSKDRIAIQVLLK